MQLFEGLIGREARRLLVGGTQPYGTFSSEFRGRGDSSYPSYIHLPEDVRKAVETVTLDVEHYERAHVRFLDSKLIGGSGSKREYVVLGEPKKKENWFVEYPRTGQAFAVQVLGNVRQKLKKSYSSQLVSNSDLFAGIMAALCCWVLVLFFYQLSLDPNAGMFPVWAFRAAVATAVLGIAAFCTPFAMVAYDRFTLGHALDKLSMAAATTMLSSLRGTPAS